MTQRIEIPLSLPLESAVKDFSDKLSSFGYQVDPIKVHYRVLRARKDFRQFTCFHTGLTSKAKIQRSFLRISGPEEKDILEILRPSTGLDIVTLNGLSDHEEIF